MAYHVYTCNGYKLLSSHHSGPDAMREAERRQAEATDDYGLFIVDDGGRIVADPIDGWHPPPERVTDHATLTGMYDRY